MTNPGDQTRVEKMTNALYDLEAKDFDACTVAALCQFYYALQRWQGSVVKTVGRIADQLARLDEGQPTLGGEDPAPQGRNVVREAVVCDAAVRWMRVRTMNVNLRVAHSLPHHPEYVAAEMDLLKAVAAMQGVDDG